MKTELSPDGKFLTIHIPMRFRKRGGRKLLIAASDSPGWVPPKPKKEDNLIRALAKAHHWRMLLDTGQVSSMDEIAKMEKIRASYVGRMMDLTLLAPDIVKAILNGRQPKGLSLREFRDAIPIDWEEQRQKFGFPKKKKAVAG